MAISLRKLKERLNGPEVFEVHEITPCGDVVMRRKQSDFSKHAAWVRKHQWPARVVIVIGEVAIAAMYLVFWILVGAGFSG